MRAVDGCKMSFCDPLIVAQVPVPRSKNGLVGRSLPGVPMGGPGGPKIGFSGTCPTFRKLFALIFCGNAWTHVRAENRCNTVFWDPLVVTKVPVPRSENGLVGWSLWAVQGSKNRLFRNMFLRQKTTFANMPGIFCDGVLHKTAALVAYEQAE